MTDSEEIIRALNNKLMEAQRQQKKIVQKVNTLQVRLSDANNYLKQYGIQF